MKKVLTAMVFAAALIPMTLFANGQSDSGGESKKKSCILPERKEIRLQRGWRTPSERKRKNIRISNSI